MLAFEGLEENFRFLVIEVQNQVNSTFRFLGNTEDGALYRKIVEKDDYIDNLKAIIENESFSLIHRETSADRRRVNHIRSVNIICVNLERIADFCVNIVRQTDHLKDPSVLMEYGHTEIFQEILKSLCLVIPCLAKNDLPGALAICKSEAVLDSLYKKTFDEIMERLGEGRNLPDLITVLFIFRYLERIGDSLLNIGEAIIFAVLGEKIKIERFDALKNTLARAGLSESISEGDFTAIWGTRSGCHIGRLGAGDVPKIYKEGTISKIGAERDNLLLWGSFLPGIAPSVLDYRQNGEKASILVEFLSGRSLDEVILAAKEPVLETAVVRLTQVLGVVWTNSRAREPVTTDYMGQLTGRLDSVLSVHPGFLRREMTVGKAVIESTMNLIGICREIEKRLPAPFSVFIHGDFNVNNLLFNEEKETVHFIDLHRSKRSDYVQDTSVFLVSNHRLPVFDSPLRARINRVIGLFFDFASSFAEKNRDTTFQARLALALARSFFTSTRFELNRDFAKDMCLKAHYLLEKIAGHDAPWDEFLLPREILT